MSKEKKFQEFVSKRIEIGTGVFKGRNYWSGREYFYINGLLNCPCGEDRLFPIQIKCDENGKTTESRISYAHLEGGWKLRTHIERKIRLNGSAEHIQILIDVLGDKESLELLEIWANKNILIGIALKKYIEELKLRQLLKSGEKRK